MLAGIGLAGASVLAGCSQAKGAADAGALAGCYRTIQRASLALQVARPDMTPEERRAASRQLGDARARLLQTWATHEGLTISAEHFSNESAQAAEFVEGVNAEAGLGEQERLSTLSEAGDAPEKWREKLTAAFDCTDRLAS